MTAVGCAMQLVLTTPSANDLDLLDDALEAQAGNHDADLFLHAADPTAVTTTDVVAIDPQ